MVAIKYLAPELLTDPRHMAMCRDEVNMLARVANPHVARLFEYAETPEGAAITMEAVNGVSLRDVLSQNPPAASGGGPDRPQGIPARTRRRTRGPRRAP